MPCFIRVFFLCFWLDDRPTRAGAALRAAPSERRWAKNCLTGGKTNGIISGIIRNSRWTTPSRPSRGARWRVWMWRVTPGSGSPPEGGGAGLSRPRATSGGWLGRLPGFQPRPRRRRERQWGLLWRRGAWPFFAVRAPITSCALLPSWSSLLLRRRRPPRFLSLPFQPPLR